MPKADKQNADNTSYPTLGPGRVFVLVSRVLRNILNEGMLAFFDHSVGQNTDLIVEDLDNVARLQGWQGRAIAT